MPRAAPCDATTRFGGSSDPGERPASKGAWCVRGGADGKGRGNSDLAGGLLYLSGSSSRDRELAQCMHELGTAATDVGHVDQDAVPVSITHQCGKPRITCRGACRETVIENLLSPLNGIQHPPSIIETIGVAEEPETAPLLNG